MTRPMWILAAGVIGGVLLLTRSGFPADPAGGGDASAAAPASAEDVFLEDIPADEWLNSEGPVSGDDLRGDVVLVEFWTYLCYNCKNIEPWMKETWAEFGPQGLRVVAVHTPEFQVERDVGRVRGYLDDNGITYPVAIDNGWRVWRRYNSTHAWPAFLVFDRSGRLIYRRAGERAVHGAREAIERALAEPAPSADQDGPARLGARVSAQARRVSPRRAVLEVTLSGKPGHRVVRSPPSEVWIDSTPELDSIAGTLSIGEPFTGRDARDLTYLDGPASTRLELLLADSAGSRPLVVSGWLRTRTCDEGRDICITGRLPFEATVPSFNG